MSLGEAVVTGACSYTGAAVTLALRGQGWRVRTLTRRRIPPAENIRADPLLFERGHLIKTLQGADVFINTFWIRLPGFGESFEGAVEKSKLLLSCAKEAGVKRIVHVSVSNAGQGRNLGYYRGKHDVELFLQALGVPYAIVRPTLIVGPGDVLTNNIAWFLRRFPVFFVPQGGAYRLQPITLTDVGKIIADAAEGPENVELDAAGPEVFTFEQYIRLLQKACGLRRLLISVPNSVALLAIRFLESILKDSVLVKEELLGLEQELLLSHLPARGKESVSQWLMQHGEALGKKYVNDIKRHFTDKVTRPVLTPNGLKQGHGDRAL